MLGIVPRLRTHRKISVALIVLVPLALLNVLAYRHAYTMTHFARGGRPKATPEERPHPEELGLAHKIGVLLGGVTLYRPTNEFAPDGVGLAYETMTFPGPAGALEAWYVPRTDARGLVLLFHGYGGCKTELLPEVKAFNDLGYACFLIDFPGSGGSAGDSTTIGWREADDAAATITYAREKWPGERLILFGQSMGAAAILRAMATHGVKADATVLECPFDTLLHTVEMRFHAMGVPSFPGTRLLVFWGGLQNGFNGFDHNPAEYAKSATGPILMLHGARDNRVTPAQLQTIYDNLPGEKELHFFEGLGHEFYVVKRPKEWKEWVGRFLAK